MKITLTAGVDQMKIEIKLNVEYDQYDVGDLLVNIQNPLNDNDEITIHMIMNE